MGKQLKTMDGNEAAAYVSYAFTEVATIYPITPSSPMAELVDVWSAQGKKNLFGQSVRLVEMQSEAGAAGAMHGALETGALATSYTASQGLMLMVPTMFRLAGQLHPGVLHVSARTVGTHAFSIFGEHSDVMACRQTGFAMLCSSSVQEVMDLAGVAHLAAIKGRVPFLHFFDGFRTSHEIQKVEVMGYEDLGALLDRDALQAHRNRALNPEHPVMRSTVQNPDVYFQNRESANPYYERLPEIVEEYMKEISRITGRNYRLFNYYGAEDADHVIVAMGSSAGVIREVVDHLNARGEKTGFLQVHLYRPFSVGHFLKELPETVGKITVLDRTKEPGSIGEPLYLDVCAAICEQERKVSVYGGRYGLSIKDVTPEQIFAVFENMKAEKTRNHFTVGIVDDVTFKSLPLGKNIDVAPEGTISCKFWGLGSDGTVGANKNSIKIIGDHTDMYVQAYFEYDTKKSGGLTRSHLRFGKHPIQGSYLVSQADFVACHNESYIDKYDIVQEIKPGGTFLLNCTWEETELENRLPAKVKKYIAENNISFYMINAIKVGKEIGIGNRTNGVLQSAFFKLAEIIPAEEAMEYMKKAVEKSYGKKGEKIVAMNYLALEKGAEELIKVQVPEAWRNAEVQEAEKQDAAGVRKHMAQNPSNQENCPAFVENIVKPINSLKGDLLPVSAFKGMEDGTVPLGTSQYEKRGTAVDIPVWKPESCIQCSQCSFACPHAAIRPFLLTEKEAESTGLKTVAAKGVGMDGYRYRIQISPLDCLGCGICVQICPAKEKALGMAPLESQMAEAENWRQALDLSPKENPMDKMTVKGSQFEQPLLEFSGACAGCGETAYMKLMTQMFGDHMIVANATGCTQAWGAAMPSFPYTVNKDGCGPAWSNSLFENNAEFSLGMILSVKQQRERVKERIEELDALLDAGICVEPEGSEERKDCLCKNGREALRAAAAAWLKDCDNREEALKASRNLVELLREYVDFLPERERKLSEEILAGKDQLSKKSLWMYGGDGWAYDIGYGGLDHVLASGENVNILVVDTEVYSNTGGQASKASQIGAVAQFAASGKKTRKKDLGLLAMSYGYVYVAQVAMGANPAQLVKVLKEAEAYDGPSLIIAYAPCINHGLTKGMGCAHEEMKLAVKSGYWNLYHYNPELKKEGKNPFILDSKEPDMDLKEFLMGEVRFASLTRTFPEEAERLLSQAEINAREKYREYEELAGK